MNTDGSGAQNLTNNEDIADWGPSWSPDGSQIAFNSSRDHAGRLRGYLMNTDGSNVTMISDEIWIEYPAWSPDGTKIAFMAQTPEGSNNYEIWVINANGTGLVRLTDSPGSDGWPSWSPDGSRIVFSSVRDDCSYSKADDCLTTGDIGPFHTLYVMNADGSGQMRITDVYAQFSDWSPDGQYIVFDGSGELHIIRPDGSGLVSVPTGLGYCGFPDWEQ
jgi:Tol biopolymer transport system component